MTKPQDMSPERLRSFVKEALSNAKAQPLPEDVEKWRDATKKRSASKSAHSMSVGRRVMTNQ